MGRERFAGRGRCRLTADEMLAQEERQGRIAFLAETILEDLILSEDLSVEDADERLWNLRKLALALAEKELTPS